MNKLLAKVVEINTNKNLSIVKFDFNTYSLSMMSLEVGNIDEGAMVVLGVKPTNIAIAKDFSGAVSYSNKLLGTVEDIDSGELLSSVTIAIDKDTSIQSIITYNSAHRLQLKVGDSVTIFIKASEISIVEILDD